MREVCCTHCPRNLKSPKTPGQGVRACWYGNLECAVPHDSLRDMCSCFAVALRSGQPDFMELWENSSLREAHSCFVIWVRKYLPCNLYTEGPIAKDKQEAYLCATM